MSAILCRVPHRLLLACAALVLFSACSRPSDRPDVRFSITHTDQVGDPGSPSAGARALATPVYTGAAVSVNGIILVPDRCDKVGARLDHDSTSLLLRIRAQLSSGHDGDCGSEREVTLLQYSADLANLPPGKYRLRVVNEYRGLRATDPAARRWTNTTAFEGEVTAGARRP